jgi:CMP-N-acetylneuraminic acid synthetase
MLNKTLIVIPSRSGSKGIKNKNLKKISKKSLIEITSNFINKIKYIDKKIISTDSQKIKNMSKKLGFEIINRPKIISGDRVSDYQVIKHALTILKKKNLVFDYLIYLQPTSPIRRKEDLIKNIKTVINNNFDSCWSVSKIDKKFHPLKILNIKNEYLKLYNNHGIKIIARQQLNDSYVRNGIFYIFKCKSLLKYKTIYLKKCLPAITKYNHINIDTKKDLLIAKKLYN